MSIPGRAKGNVAFGMDLMKPLIALLAIVKPIGGCPFSSISRKA